MTVCFDEDAWADYLYWQRTDAKKVKRINELIRDIVRNPLEGLGKAEPLRHEWAGWWSRRIDGEHRLVYRVTLDAIVIAQCRYHY